MLSHDEPAALQPQPRDALRLALLCLSLACSGYILQGLSFALPDLLHHWRLESADLSAAFSLHLLGVTVGALWLGRAGDRFGRRTMLLVSLGVQGVATLACQVVATPGGMGLARLIAGLGVGGMTPNAVSLAVELAPRRWRSTGTTLVLSGMALGSSVPALAVRAFVPSQGWQVIFLIGGLASLLLPLAILAFVPESEAFQATRRGDDGSKGPASKGLAQLFSGPLARATTCLWVMYAGAMLAMHLVTSWLPVLLERAGLGASRAASLTGMVHLAGAVATLSTAVLLSWWGRRWLVALLCIAFASAGLLAWEGFATGHASLVIAALGFGLVGTQGALGTLASHVYPTPCRPTGVGAAIAVGRAGSMLGPLIGGAVQTAGYSAEGLFTLPLFTLAAALVAAGFFPAAERNQTGGN